MADDPASPLSTDAAFLQGAAMVMAQLCRRGEVYAAQLVACDLNLDYGAFVRAEVDEADLEELREVFEVAGPGEVIPFKRGQ